MFERLLLTGWCMVRTTTCTAKCREILFAMTSKKPILPLKRVFEYFYNSCYNYILHTCKMDCRNFKVQLLTDLLYKQERAASSCSSLWKMKMRHWNVSVKLHSSLKTHTWSSWIITVISLPFVTHTHLCSSSTWKKSSFLIRLCIDREFIHSETQTVWESSHSVSSFVGHILCGAAVPHTQTWTGSVGGHLLSLVTVCAFAFLLPSSCNVCDLLIIQLFPLNPCSSWIYPSITLSH